MEKLLLFIDYAGVAVFAITGCLVAAKKQLDIVSFVLLAAVTGIGGGTARDVVLGNLPVFWVKQPLYLIDCVVTAIVMFFVARHVASYQKWIVWGDAVGVAVFTVTGAKIALDAGAHWSVCITMGVMTSIVGGIIRDILAGEPSLIIRKEIYATACALGAAVFLVVHTYAPTMAVLAGVASCFALRAAAIIWRLQLPGYQWIEDHTEKRRASDGSAP
ncbi:MAG: trimeric intracellular cation channel family protein [Alphaproteobacteria bacterium]|nr:trimeric intracellular cation channel family protein [Alphaproteobacteria bacterium]